MDDWKPHIPGLLSAKEVVRQIGREPTLYVMRRKEEGAWKYRECTPDELSEIERKATS